MKETPIVWKVEIEALRGVDLTVKRGVFAAVKGRSGSGKTTLLNLIGGLDRPTDGEVYFDDLNPCELSERELTELRRKRIGFVFQSFCPLRLREHGASTAHRRPRRGAGGEGMELLRGGGAFQVGKPSSL